MDNFKLCIKSNDLHHAYCIFGNAADVVSGLKLFLQKELNFSVNNNPDFWYGEFDVMDIDDGRAIKILHQNKPTAGDRKIFIVTANFITEKAQNAMLKLFEEPRGDTHFFLILPSMNNIIPTFKSRFFVIDSYTINNYPSIDPKKFLTTPINKRLELVKDLCGKVSDEEKSKIEIINFIGSLEVELKNRINLLTMGKKEIKMFEEIEKARQYANEQSPSLKMLLEHISLLVPVFK